MNKEQFTKEDFFKNSLYKDCIDELQRTFSILFHSMEKEKIEFTIKIRKDNSIVLSPNQNTKKNILTIWIYKKHLRINIYNKKTLNIYTDKDINETLVNDIRNRYFELNKDKKQISIYLNEDIIKKAQKKAKENHKKLNEFITEAIEDKLNSIFIDENHKKEFSILLRDSGIYSEEDKYKDGIPEDIKNKVTFFYLVSSYQDCYLETYGSKVEFDKITGNIACPSDLINYWEDDLYAQTSATYGIFEILLKKSPAENLFEILALKNSTINKLLINSYDLMYGSRYTLYKDEIVERDFSQILIDIQSFVDKLHNE